MADANKTRTKTLAADGAFPRTVVHGMTWRPHEDLYHFVLTRPWSQFFALVAVAYLVVNAAFAALYLASPGCVQGVTDAKSAFFISVQRFSTIRYGSMAPVTRYANVVMTVEALVALVGVALVTGATFAKFARPTTRVLFSRRIVVHERDGVPHLVFRLANQRHNLIVEAQLRVLLLVMHKTAEGDSIRIPHDLSLVRARTSLFALTWVPMHKIDESSPFYGGEAAIERLREQKAELFLSLQGYDETIAATVHARYRYSLDDIVLDARYADVLTIDADGTRHLDYTHFDEVLPAPPTSKRDAG